MSLLAFQKAMANLVRYPDAKFDELIGHLGEENLSGDECQTLRALSRDPLVTKFGKKMQFLRQREALSVMRLSAEHLPRPLLDQLYFESFEPARKSSDPLWIGVEFLKMILTDPLCAKQLEDCPPYIVDLLKYDYAKAFVTRLAIGGNDPDLKTESMLCYSQFEIVDLSTDVPAYDKAKWDASLKLVVPAERPMKMLFLPLATGPFYRMFQIDSEIETFLLIQRDDPRSWNGPLPKAYSAMVKVGLCRLLN